MKLKNFIGRLTMRRMYYQMTRYLLRQKHMTYTGGEFSMDALFRELSGRAMLERIDIYEAYAELVDALIEEKKSYGFLSDEEDLQQIKRDLLARWPRLQNMLAESGILMLP